MAQRNTLAIFFLSIWLVACGDDGGSDSSSDPSSEGDAASNTHVDAGKKDAGKVSTPTPSPSDAGSAHKDATVGTLDAGNRDAGGSARDAATNSCEHVACTNILDCVVFNPAGLACGFTACTAMVCVK